MWSTVRSCHSLWPLTHSVGEGEGKKMRSELSSMAVELLWERGEGIVVVNLIEGLIELK